MSGREQWLCAAAWLKVKSARQRTSVSKGMEAIDRVLLGSMSYSLRLAPQLCPVSGSFGTLGQLLTNVPYLSNLTYSQDSKNPIGCHPAG